MTGNQLASKIISKGMTQSQFAERVGVSARTIRRWCSGKVKISAMAQKAIDQVIGNNASNYNEQFRPLTM